MRSSNHVNRHYEVPVYVKQGNVPKYSHKVTAEQKVPKDMFKKMYQKQVTSQ